jgi:SAM-dependent methyltransferase
MRDWLSFWNAPNRIYVSERHRDVHYRDVALQIRALVPAENATVLDYGCGEATHADLVAEVAGRLLLSDGAPAVRERLTARFKDHPRIAVLAPGEVAALAPSSIDLIVLNSVAQYLKPAEFEALLRLFRRLLRPDGTLVVGDVVPPQAGTVSDVAALLKLAWSNGFVLAAAAGLARTLFSDYRALRRKIGLTCYAEEEMIALLARAGFTARRRHQNIEHNQARMTFVAAPAAR